MGRIGARPQPHSVKKVVVTPQTRSGKNGFGATQADSNPYDSLLNKRRRHQVLGQRVRGEHRDVAKSRSKAALQRAQGLLKEVQKERRTSSFKDLRLGERDADTDGHAGKCVQRLVRLRQREAKRSFALSGRGRDELMVGGRPLSTLADEELRQSGGGGSDEELENGAEPISGEAEDVIQRSKLQKAEAVKEKEDRERQRSQLDAEFGDILGQLSFRPPKAAALRIDLSESEKKKAAPDSYDRVLKEMAFERKVTASERTKTAEEIEREKAEKLEALERARVKRAQGDDDADEVIAEGLSSTGGEVSAAVMAEEGEDQEGDNDDADVDEGAESESAEGGDEGEEEEEEEEEETETGEEAHDDADADDTLGTDCIPLLSAREISEVDVMLNRDGEDCLSYRPECPNKISGVRALLGGKAPRTTLKLVERVRTCTAASLAPENKARLKAFFLALLEYVLEVVARSDGDISAAGMQLLYVLRPPLLDLAGEYPETAHAFFAERLQAMGPETLPRASELCCLKLIALLFPVTDFQHAVVTPAAILAAHWASRLAELGHRMSDLVSDAMFLWEVLHGLSLPDQRFCAPFYQLGMALIESCLSSAAAGRSECLQAANDVAELLIAALRALAVEDPVAARIAGEELLRPVLQRLRPAVPSVDAAAPLSTLAAALDALAGRNGFTPLQLFEAPPPQIRTLEPIFHMPGDQPRSKGMDMSESKRLKRKLNEERRTAARQLSRDALVMQQLQARKDTTRRVARAAEKNRVTKMMDVEKQELKKMMTEVGGGMDTSLKSYSSTKARKKVNRRVGGDTTAETRKTPKERPAKKATQPAVEGGSRGKKSTKKRKGGL